MASIALATTNPILPFRRGRCRSLEGSYRPLPPRRHRRNHSRPRQNLPLRSRPRLPRLPLITVSTEGKAGGQYSTHDFLCQTRHRCSTQCSGLEVPID